MKLIIIIAATVDVEETSYLYQRISVALQRFNAIWICNTFRDVLYDDDCGWYINIINVIVKLLE